MFVLRIAKPSQKLALTKLELSFRGKILATQNCKFDFNVSSQDREDIRWYLEDYLSNAFDPAPSIAARIEHRIDQIGKQLFAHIFLANQGTAELWTKARGHLANTRIEIATDIQTSALIPWELIRDPETSALLSLRAHSFVRVHAEARSPVLSTAYEGPVRILLVISRPEGAEDVPYRTVATQLVKVLAGNADFQLDVLRPPTFDHLARKVREALSEGRPYQVVHFDGHGIFLASDSEEHTNQPITFGGRVPFGIRAGAHGYLVFETPKHIEGAELIGGPELSGLMREAGVPVLVLNACRSAHAESPSQPDEAATNDVHGQTNAFGSLAQEVVDAGVSGVVAMRYKVYAVTAAQFVAKLYTLLSRGYSLGEAVTLGRRQLAEFPLRDVAQRPLPLQDWQVPVVYELSPIVLRSAPTTQRSDLPTERRERQGHRGEKTSSSTAKNDFVGRDETILLLDRAFDYDNSILLHGNAGAGKTSSAREFAQWYAATRGILGPVLFTSFDTYKPAERVVDQTEQAFAVDLARAGQNWLAMNDNQRHELMLDLLNQRSSLWIWDSVEAIAGFPSASHSAWTEQEQRALRALLSEIRKTKAKILLTSRRDERQWLGDMVTPIGIRPMSLSDSLQLAKDIATKYRRQLTDLDDWRPLLKYARGNPLTLISVIGQALRNDIRSKRQIDDYLAELTRGETNLQGDPEEGRSRSLYASLNYGFKHGFSEDERKVLAVLHLFQGYVNFHVITAMGKTPEPWRLAEIDRFSPEQIAGILERASEAGLLTSRGGGHYEIHPALPWFFKTLHDRYYQPGSDLSNAAQSARSERAFVETLSRLGMHFLEFYEHGRKDVTESLVDEESNLLHSSRLAQAHGWWAALPGLIQGLFGLYQHTGRRAEWSRLLAEVSPQFVDRKTGESVTGREQYWPLIIDYHLRLAMEARDWATAERLARLILDNDRPKATRVLEPKSRKIKPEEHLVVRNLATSLGRVGDILRDQGNPVCITYYEEAISLYQRMKDASGEAARAFNMGHAYKNLPGIRNLTKSEAWYKKSLALRPEADRLSRAQCLGQLGSIELERVEEASGQAKQPHVEAAAQYYEEALSLTPEDAIIDIGIVHSQLGNVYVNFFDTHQLALEHWYEAIRFAQAVGDVHRAAGIRNNIAMLLYETGRVSDARDYTQSALSALDQAGIAAPDLRSSLNSLLQTIENALQGGN